MKKMPIGLQLYSVRDAMEKNFYGTLKEVKAMGYDAVEFAGLFGHTAAEIKEMCADLGLDPISAHVGRAVIMADLEGVIKTYADIGCRYIALPWADWKVELPGADGYEAFKEDVRKIAETKMPDLNAASVEAAMSMIAGTARSMGVVVGE